MINITKKLRAALAALCVISLTTTIRPKLPLEEIRGLWNRIALEHRAAISPLMGFVAHETGFVNKIDKYGRCLHKRATDNLATEHHTTTAAASATAEDRTLTEKHFCTSRCKPPIVLLQSLLFDTLNGNARASTRAQQVFPLYFIGTLLGILSNIEQTGVLPEQLIKNIIKQVFAVFEQERAPSRLISPSKAGTSTPHLPASFGSFSQLPSRPGGSPEELDWSLVLPPVTTSSALQQAGGSFCVTPEPREAFEQGEHVLRPDRTELVHSAQTSPVRQVKDKNKLIEALEEAVLGIIAERSIPTARILLLEYVYQYVKDKRVYEELFIGYTGALELFPYYKEIARLETEQATLEYQLALDEKQRAALEKQERRKQRKSSTESSPHRAEATGECKAITAETAEASMRKKTTEIDLITQQIHRIKQELAQLRIQLTSLRSNIESIARSKLSSIVNSEFYTDKYDNAAQFCDRFCQDIYRVITEVYNSSLPVKDKKERLQVYLQTYTEEAALAEIAMSNYYGPYPKLIRSQTMLLSILTEHPYYSEGDEHRKKSLKREYMPGDCVEVAFRNLLRFVMHKKPVAELPSSLSDLRTKLQIMGILTTLDDSTIFSTDAVNTWADAMQNMPYVRYIRRFTGDETGKLIYTAIPLEKGKPVYVSTAPDDDVWFYFEQGPCIENIIITLCHLLDIAWEEGTPLTVFTEQIKQKLQLKDIAIISAPKDHFKVINQVEGSTGTLDYTYGDVIFTNDQGHQCTIMLQQKHCITKFKNNNASESNHALGKESTEVTFWHKTGVEKKEVKNIYEDVVRSVLSPSMHILKLAFSENNSSNETEEIQAVMPFMAQGLQSTMQRNALANLCEQAELEEKDKASLLMFIQNLTYNEQDAWLLQQILEKLMLEQYLSNNALEILRLLLRQGWPQSILKKLTSYTLAVIERKFSSTTPNPTEKVQQTLLAQQLHADRTEWESVWEPSLRDKVEVVAAIHNALRNKLGTEDLGDLEEGFCDLGI